MLDIKDLVVGFWYAFDSKIVGDIYFRIKEIKGKRILVSKSMRKDGNHVYDYFKGEHYLFEHLNQIRSVSIEELRFISNHLKPVFTTNNFDIC